MSMPSDRLSRESQDIQRRDLVVVGSGGAAFTAAITAAKAGLNVLMVEKTSLLGGTTAMSGGYAWLPLGRAAISMTLSAGENLHGGMQTARTNAAIQPSTAPQPEPDTLEEAECYLKHLTGEHYRPEIVRAFLENAPKLVTFLSDETEVRFQRLPWYIDYRSESPGAKQATRTLGPQPYDGRRLGSDLALVRPSHDMLTVLGGMNLDANDLKHMFSATRSLKSLWHVMKRACAYARDLVVWSRGARLTNGNALIGRLLKSARDAGVDIWVDSPAIQLFTDGSRVTAVEVLRNQERLKIDVRGGIILATGGFSHDPELRQRYLPFPEQRQSVTTDSNQGDGVRMAMAVGAALKEAGYNNFAGIAVSSMRLRDGTVKKMLHSRSSQKPGIIAVNNQGARFANEALPYNDFQHIVVRESAVPAYLICDHRHLRNYGFGLIRPGPAWLRPLTKYIASGYLFRAGSIPKLATDLGISSESLDRTVKRFNQMARAGKDLDFLRGDSRYDHTAADPGHAPNPSLGPIDVPPYYAIRIDPGDMGTFAGLRTDANARVLNDAGLRIEGLYACGLDMVNPFSGNYPGGGGSIGPGMVFGFIAARDLVTQTSALVQATGANDTRSVDA